MRVQSIAIVMVLLLTAGLASAANIAIIESQSINNTFNQDEIWQTVAQNMGHTATIYPQTFMDDFDNFFGVDLLIISSATIDIPSDRRMMLREALLSGTAIYIQSEYEASFPSNQTWRFLVNNTGGNFNWLTTEYGNLAPMQIIGDLAIADNTVYSIPYFQHGCTANHGFNVIGNMNYAGDEYGWLFDPGNTFNGIIATNTDRNWILEEASPELMENYITLLLDDETTNPTITITPDGSMTVPPGGAVLQFDVQVINTGNSFLNCDAWAEIDLPNGNVYGPVSVHQNLTFWIDYTSPVYDVGQFVPNLAPAGDYTYRVILGNLDYHSIYTTDSVDFTKLASGPESETIHTWNAFGFDQLGKAVASESGNTAAGLPESFELGTPYPNPFNPSTTVQVALPEAGDLQLTVVDVTGRQVATLAQGAQSAGTHEFTFDAHSVASGVYFLQAQFGGTQQFRKLVLMK